ncbi:hypothetical protein DL96DRAFT_1550913 [Flagelloscypha sp. PMI_526]|nr:hypothetical protein DL96DRAFT_1550913 [Flagelloscypha sp. PMI_526]
MFFTLLALPIIVASLILGAAYLTGSLDPLITYVKVKMLQGAAQAEAAALTAKGQDVAQESLKGNIQADELSKSTGVNNLSDVKSAVELPKVEVPQIKVSGLGSL